MVMPKGNIRLNRPQDVSRSIKYLENVFLSQKAMMLLIQLLNGLLAIMKNREYNTNLED